MAAATVSKYQASLQSTRLATKPAPPIDVPAELDQLGRKKLEPADRPAGGEHDDERREEPTHATGVEMGEAELLLLQAVGDDAGDQEARDDEEDVDADEAAGHPARKRVVGDDRQDRDTA